MSRNSQKGFTLVELSIVLVIIGLIISSVLVGQDLIKAAELRATVTQYESFNAAIGTFKVKYRGLPGDVAGATSFGFTGDGNGDGTLAASTALSGENVYFWNHLGASGAGLISGSYAGAAVDTDAGAGFTLAENAPTSKVGEGWGVFAASGINYFVVGATGSAVSGTYLTTDVFTPLDARGVDEKIDDGRPGRGVVNARHSHATDANIGGADQATMQTCVSAAGAATPFAPTAASTYSTTLTGVSCTLRIRISIK